MTTTSTIASQGTRGRLPLVRTMPSPARTNAPSTISATTMLAVLSPEVSTVRLCAAARVIHIGREYVGQMTSRTGRIVLTVVGVIAVLVGLVWIGQGAGLIPGSSMTGDRMWLVIGLIVGFVGAVLIVIGRRKPRA